MVVPSLSISVSRHAEFVSASSRLSRCGAGGGRDRRESSAPPRSLREPVAAMMFARRRRDAERVCRTGCSCEVRSVWPRGCAGEAGPRPTPGKSRWSCRRYPSPYAVMLNLFQHPVGSAGAAAWGRRDPRTPSAPPRSLREPVAATVSSGGAEARRGFAARAARAGSGVAAARMCGRGWAPAFAGEPWMVVAPLPISLRRHAEPVSASSRLCRCGGVERERPSHALRACTSLNPRRRSASPYGRVWRPSARAGPACHFPPAWRSEYSGLFRAGAGRRGPGRRW